jgi:hypothetical protein
MYFALLYAAYSLPKCEPKYRTGVFHQPAKIPNRVAVLNGDSTSVSHPSQFYRKMVVGLMKPAVTVKKGNWDMLSRKMCTHIMPTLCK